jgi:hypothetical protein
MLQRMLGEAMDGRVFRTATDVIRWAIANDPYLDYATVFKRIKAIRQQQGDLAADLLSMASPIAGFSAASRSAIAGVPRAGREGRAGPVTATPDEDTAVRQC